MTYFGGDSLNIYLHYSDATTCKVKMIFDYFLELVNEIYFENIL